MKDGRRGPPLNTEIAHSRHRVVERSCPLSHRVYDTGRLHKVRPAPPLMVRGPGEYAVREMVVRRGRIAGVLVAVPAPLEPYREIVEQ